MKRVKDEKKVFRKELLTAKKNLMVIGVCFVIALIVQLVSIFIAASADENTYTIKQVQIAADEYRYVLTEQNASAEGPLEVTVYDYQNYKRMGGSYCKYLLLRNRIELGLELLLICAILFVLDSLVDDIRKTQDYFTASIAKRLRQVSLYASIFVVAPKIILLLADIFVTSTYALSITSTDVFILVLSDVLYIVSKIIEAGREMKEELEQIA